MEKNYTIVIDTLGSDKGPEAIIEGAKLVLNEFNNVNITLVGDEELIKSKGLPTNRVKIIHGFPDRDQQMSGLTQFRKMNK